MHKQKTNKQTKTTSKNPTPNKQANTHQPKPKQANKTPPKPSIQQYEHFSAELLNESCATDKASVITLPEGYFGTCTERRC